MAKRRRRAARGNSGLLVYAGVGLAALLLLNRKASAAASSSSSSSRSPVLTTTPVILPPAAVPGAMAPTATTTSVSAAIWQNLTPSAGPTSGYVNFPTGSQAAALFLPWAGDSAGNAYTMWAGQIYIVDMNADADGNYPAKRLGT